MANPESPVRIGVSSCLLGEQVRYDGGHKRDPFLVETFGRFVSWVPVCPELELGLGVPRDSIRLERRDGEVRLVRPNDGQDLTDGMRAFAESRVSQLAPMGLSGYVLKKDSPSCGLERVRVYPEKGMPVRNGRGVFAEVLMQRLPLLPVEEEGRLGDPRLRENFVQRVFAYHRLQAFFAGRWSVASLVVFHTAHKLLLMAHSPEAYRRIGRLVARAKAVPRPALREGYSRELMESLAAPANARRHVNVLQHMLGHFSDRLDTNARAEVASLIEDYRKGLVPLVVPLTLIRHHVRRLDVSYLSGQIYLEPHPKQLMLLNHV